MTDDHLTVNKIESKINENGLKEIVSPNKILAESLINQIKDIHNFPDYNSFTVSSIVAQRMQENISEVDWSMKNSLLYKSKLGQLVRNLERDYNINAKKTEIADAQERIKFHPEAILERLRDRWYNYKHIRT